MRCTGAPEPIGLPLSRTDSRSWQFACKVLTPMQPGLPCGERELQPRHLHFNARPRSVLCASLQPLATHESSGSRPGEVMEQGTTTYDERDEIQAAGSG